MRNFFFLSLISIFLNNSCKNQNTNISIMPTPVFSEIDTSEMSAEKKPFSRHDYFLVKGNFRNKQKLKDAIDSFARKNVQKKCNNFGNYIMFFYRESSEINQKEILKEDSAYRYKIFLYNDEDYIASYSSWNSIPSNTVEFQPKYK